MKQRVAFFAAAALALAGAVIARATPPGSVDEALILGNTMPEQLSAFGFFADGAAQVPGKGIEAYRLNTPLWSDGAEKLRFVYIPNGLKAAAREPGDHGGLLELPVGSALIKTFAFEENGKRRLIETRLLLRRASGWVCGSGVWSWSAGPVLVYRTGRCRAASCAMALTAAYTHDR